MTNLPNTPEVPVQPDTQPEPAPERELTPDEAQLIYAIRHGNPHTVARATMSAFLAKGVPAADLLKHIAALDADVLPLFVRALADELNPPEPYVVKPDPSVAPYEECIAAYVVGQLALGGYLQPDFISGHGSLSDMTRSVAAWLLNGGAAYGWEGSLREPICYADAGTPAGWKSADLDGAS